MTPQFNFPPAPVLLCICAIHARTYTLRYAWEPINLRRPADVKTELLEVEAGTESLADFLPCRRGEHHRPSGKLDREFKNWRFLCPWCGDESLSVCRGCGCLVCGGATERIETPADAMTAVMRLETARKESNK